MNKIVLHSPYSNQPLHAISGIVFLQVDFERTYVAFNNYSVLDNHSVQPLLRYPSQWTPSFKVILES